MNLVYELQELGRFALHILAAFSFVAASLVVPSLIANLVKRIKART